MGTTNPDATTFDLFTRHLQFDASGTIRADERRLAGNVDADWRLALYHAETADDVHPDHWEMHPLADEAVCCLNGALRLYLRATQPHAPDDFVHVLPGQGVIVPRGRWHRLELDEPTDILAATVRQGTELENVISRTDARDQVGKIKGPQS